MANRCFVHEDARRVPRVAPWLPSSSRSYFNGGPQNLPQHLMPISLHIQTAYSASTNLPQVTKWGLQLESSLKCQIMGSMQLHLNASECGLKSIRKEETDHTSLKGEQISMVELWNSTAMEEEVPYLTGKMESEYTEGIDIKIQNKESGLSWCPSMSLAKFGQVHLLFSSNPKTGPEKLNSYSPPRNAYKKLYENASTREPNGILNSKQELSKAQLLEALLRSQTRARKAEKAAQKACKEKDRIVNLFFTQTSHLFAHKLWFKLLQSEALHFYHQSHGSYVSIRREKGQRRKLESSGCGTALAMGLSLAAVGLFCGWATAFLLSSS